MTKNTVWTVLGVIVAVVIAWWLVNVLFTVLAVAIKLVVVAVVAVLVFIAIRMLVGRAGRD